MISEAGDGWRYYSPCRGGCGTAVVTILRYVNQGLCVDCGRREHGSAVPARPAPGASNHLRMGQGGVARPGRLDPTRLLPAEAAPAGRKGPLMVEDDCEPGRCRAADAMAEALRATGRDVRRRWTLVADRKGAPVEYLGLRTTDCMALWKRVRGGRWTAEGAWVAERGRVGVSQLLDALKGKV